MFEMKKCETCDNLIEYNTDHTKCKECANKCTNCCVGYFEYSEDTSPWIYLGEFNDEELSSYHKHDLNKIDVWLNYKGRRYGVFFKECPFCKKLIDWTKIKKRVKDLLTAQKKNNV